MTAAVPSTNPDIVRMATRQLQLLNTKLESIDHASVYGLSDDEDNTHLMFLWMILSCKHKQEQTRQSLIVCSRLKNDFVNREFN